MKFIVQERRSPIILVIVLFAFLLIISGQIKETPDRSILENTFQRITSPVVRLVSWTFNGISALWHGYISLVGIEKENRVLKRKLEILELRRTLWDEERERLKEMQEQYNAWSTDAGRVLFGEVTFLKLSDKDCTATINRGRNDGVKEGMNVVTAEGLVGKVIKLKNRFSKVLLVTDPSCNVAVRIIREEGPVEAILTGNGRICNLRFLMGNLDVHEGDQVRTSGMDDVFNPGLPAGSIEHVPAQVTDKNPITVRPAVDFNALNEIIIIKEMPELVDFDH